MRSQRALIDVSPLPTVVFGSRATTWWGMMCFMAVEGISLAICAATYFYLRKNFSAFPPEGTASPSPLLPTISVLLLLASNGIAYTLDRAAKKENFPATRLWLTVGGLSGLALFTLRLFEFRSLNISWDSNAYGSVIWVIMGFHASLLLMDALETSGLALVYWFSKVQRKHFVHASENAIYWYFTTLSWVPLYIIIIWGPRFL